MQQGVAEISQWLKSRDAVAVPQIHDGKGKVAETREEACEMIKEHLKNVWDRFGDQETKVGKLQAAKEMFRKIFQDINGGQRKVWTRPSLEHCLKKVKEAKGAAGPDGWQSHEIKALPEPVVKVF